MTHIELAKLIETMQVENSKVNDFIGRNVRCPSLVPGALYIMKEWTIKHHLNYNNPFMVVKFIGSGREENGERVMFAENPAIKNMVDGDYYYFEGVDKSEGKTYEFGAYMFEQCVCICSGAVRVTCYEIKGFEAAEPTNKPERAPREGRTPVVRKSSSRKLDIDADQPAAEDDEDPNWKGCPSAMEVHPISLRPIRPA